MIEDELKPFIDQIWTYLQQGMEHEAKICCMGVLLGIYRYDQESTSEFKDWAADIPNNCFDGLLEDWRKQCKNSALQVHRALMGRPITDSNWLVNNTGLTPATVNKSLGHIQRLGIVRELTSRKRKRVFCYTAYLEIINQGTELSETFQGFHIELVDRFTNL